MCGPVAVGSCRRTRRHPPDRDRHTRRRERTGAPTRLRRPFHLHWGRRRDRVAAADIARDARGYVLTGDDVVKAGRWSHRRDPYLLDRVSPVFSLAGT